MEKNDNSNQFCFKLSSPGTGQVWAADIPDANACKAKCTDIEGCQGYTFQPSLLAKSNSNPLNGKACSLHFGQMSAKPAETNDVSWIKDCPQE